MGSEKNKGGSGKEKDPKPGSEKTDAAQPVTDQYRNDNERECQEHASNKEYCHPGRVDYLQYFFQSSFKLKNY